MTTFTRLFSRALAAVSLLFSVDGFTLTRKRSEIRVLLGPPLSFESGNTPSNPNQDPIGPRFMRPPPSISRGNAGANFGKRDLQRYTRRTNRSGQGIVFNPLEDY